jgi:uncharacterized protein with PQ loop repeat
MLVETEIRFEIQRFKVAKRRHFAHITMHHLTLLRALTGVLSIRVMLEENFRCCLFSFYGITLLKIHVQVVFLKPHKVTESK